VNPGEVHVWRADLGSDSGLPDLVLLDDRERARAAKLRQRVDHDRYVASHAFLRRVLAGYVGAPADELQFAQGRHGKPVLSHPVGAPEFSLSHSGSVALIAVSGTGAVGVDVEEARNDVDIPGLANSVLSEQERGVLRASDPALHRALFYRAWVCKEAVLKACGAGLSIAPHRVTVLERGNASASRVELGGRSWRVRLLNLGKEGYFAAVAAPPEQALSGRIFFFEKR
jgi:4'-phosphopantetheinyl transferase